MCPPRYRFTPVENLLQLEPSSVAILGAGVVVVAGLGVVIRALRRRQRELDALSNRLDEGTLLNGPPRSTRGITAATATLTLTVPLVTVVLVAYQRAELRDCFTQAARGTPSCSHTASEALAIGADLAWGAIVTMASIPLAVVALAMLTVVSSRVAYLWSVLAIACTPTAADGRYRVSADASDGNALQRQLMRRPGSLAHALAPWSLVGLAAIALGSGVVRAHLVLLERLGGRHHGPFDPIASVEWGLADALAALEIHGMVAAVLLMVALAALATSRHAASSRWVPPPFLPAVAARVTVALALLVAAAPLARENAHPVPARAQARAASFGHFAVSPPRLRGNDDVPEAPEIHLGDAVTMDGMPLADVAELEELLRRKRELWESFHPNRPFPAIVRVAADRLASPERLRRWLGAVRRAGFDHATLLLSVSVPFEHPPLGVADGWRDVTGVTIDLSCATNAQRVDDEAPHVEALARRALEADDGAPPCLPTES